MLKKLKDTRRDNSVEKTQRNIQKSCKLIFRPQIFGLPDVVDHIGPHLLQVSHASCSAIVIGKLGS